MNPDHDHLYSLWTSKSGKLQSKTNIFLRITTIFFYQIYCCVGQDFSKKNNQFFRSEISLPQASKKKLILPLGNSFKTLKDMIIGIAAR